MSLLTIIVVAGLLVTLTIAVMGVYAMVHGEKFDTQIKLAKIGTDALSFWLIILVLYLLYRFLQ